MPTIEANGLITAYEVDGAGPPLVMLHGATGSGRDHFATLRPVVTRGFRVYLPDARGHAGTRWDPADGWTTADLVDDVIAFVDALDLPTFHLLGYSMGGMTALHVAARCPERIRTLVAISIGADREPRLRVGRVLMDPARIERDDPDWARRLVARHDPVQGSGGWRRLLDRDRRRHRGAAAPDGQRASRHRRADACRGRRSRPLRAGCAGRCARSAGP